MPKRRSKYPWENWTNGKEHTIYQDEDYEISTYNMQISLHGRARTQSLKVTSRSVIKSTRDGDGRPGRREGLRFRFTENGHGS